MGLGTKSPSIFLLLFLAFSLLLSLVDGKSGRFQITDDLDDVVDDEEDEAWVQWGQKKKPAHDEDDDLNPGDLSKMSVQEIQAAVASRQTGPAFGFVKLRLGAAKRTPDMVSEMAMKWSKVVKIGAIEARFTGVDLSTIMFTMDRGQDVSELKEFIFDQNEAYEIKIGDQVFRRPGDPPFEELIDQIHKEKLDKNAMNFKEEL